jgi:cyanophycin synthetase
VRSGISVYEVEVDLGKYASVTTASLNGFARRLVRLFPELRAHECYASEAGGFLKEMEQGTDLAHVMEHLILEMLKMASSSHRRFTGWTRRKSKNHVIHFQAPNAQAAKRAAVGAMEIIETLIAGGRVDARVIIGEIRNSEKGGRTEGRARRVQTRG